MNYTTVFNSSYKLVEKIEFNTINILVFELMKGCKIYDNLSIRSQVNKGYKAVIWCSKDYEIKELNAGEFLPPTQASKKLADMLNLIESKQIKFMKDNKEISINKTSYKMKANYFKDCESLDAAKKLYWSLAKQLHPDVGGTKEDFQELQRQFENFRPEKEKFKGEFDQWMPDQYMIIIEQLMKIPDIVITICGSWIWLSGNTKPVKDRIKSIALEGTGFKRGFSKTKLQWYFSPEGYRKFNKKQYDFDEIKAMFGSDEIESEGQKEVAA